MKRFATLLAFAGATACATPPGENTVLAPLELSDPAALLLERDRAMSREAARIGAWRALGQSAAPGAILFAPEPVAARQWLTMQDTPREAIRWSPHRVLLSCDADTAVTTGAIRWGEVEGYYTTVWRRSAAGGWRWLLSHGDAVAAPLADPGDSRIERASCAGRPSLALSAPPENTVARSVPSADQSLVWGYAVAPDGARTVTVDLWTGSEHRRALTDRVEAAR